MSLTIKTTKAPEEAANFIARSIINQLKLGARVVFLVAGGSAITVAVKVAELLENNPYQNLTNNLTITLTDERYGPVGHPDSNWQQLIDKGFSLPEAKLVPVLTGGSREEDAEKFNQFLNQEFKTDKKNKKNKNYILGLFGVGRDGHTSGILPESAALDCSDFACGYDTEKFSRITTTPRAIEQLDEAVVWAQGENKWKVLEDLAKDLGDVSIRQQPAQILKKVPSLTIFTDFKQDA